MKRVLVVPSGTEIGLEVHDALRRRRDVELLGAESTDNSHAAFVFRRNYRVPHCSASDFVPGIADLVRRHAVDHVFPAHDDVQLALLEGRATIPCGIVSSPLETVGITRFKSRTYQHLGDAVPVPRWRLGGSDAGPFPVFVKPDRGQGSQDARLCRDAVELAAALRGGPAMLVCEHLPGREVTVDCFSDRERGLLFVDARLRTRVRAGISVRAEPCEVPVAPQYARAIAARLRLYGVWFFQLKERAPGEWLLLEVGARLPGGATYQRVRGVNLPLLSLLEAERRPLEVVPQPYPVTMDRAFVSRFRLELEFRDLYVDFDDTLRLHGEPNLELVALAALARHAGRRVVLLSRNAGDCREWLAARGLATLFDEVILIDRAAAKPAHIARDGLLVDDSFAERLACAAAGIRCVDVDAVPALLDLLRPR